MNKLYRFGATVFAVIAGFAAVGAGILIVATAVFIGGVVALAAKLAIKSAQNQEGQAQTDDAFDPQTPVSA